MKNEPLIKKILTIYNLIILGIVFVIVSELCYFLIKTLLKSSSVLGGIFNFCSLVYNYLCVISFFIIYHGWAIYVVDFLIILICGLIMRKLPLTETITFIMVMCLWFTTYVTYNRFISSTLSYVKLGIDTVKRTVVALNNEPAVIILNLGSIISSILLITLCLRAIQNVLTYFCKKTGVKL